jgi:transcriptional regulator with XRE-family HTH domain
MHFFGSEVRRAREAAGMSQTELGELVPCDKSVVSRVEANLTMPDEAFAVACDAAFPSAGGWFTRFYRNSRTWGEAFAPAFRKFADDEAEATALYTFEHALLPGLLQTEGYARAVLSKHPGVSEALVGERVTGRMDRQAVITRDGPSPPMLWVVIDENVLYREVGSPKITHDALLNVAEMSRLPNLTIQVLPSGIHVGLQGSFIIAEMDGMPTSVFVEDATDGRTADDAATVNGLSVRFRYLQTEAMTTAASRDFILKVTEDRWNA